MKFEMKSEPQSLTVYNFRDDTGEFIGQGDAYIQPFTGLPANCTLESPPIIKDGHVAVFDEINQQWIELEDHRGKAAYDISTGREIYISDVGPVADNVTLIAPPDDYMKWNGTAWEKDEERQRNAIVLESHTQKLSLLKMANDTVSVLQDAFDLGMATEEEQTSLREWKKYRVLVSRINPDEAPDIVWPEQPQ